jgi:RNA polymerase sigma factor (sigma-70 family)
VRQVLAPLSADFSKIAVAERRRKKNMKKSDKQRVVIAAIQRVLRDDIQAYTIIHNECDGTIRGYVGAHYGHLDDDIQEDIVSRTHQRIFDKLSEFDQTRGPFLRWAWWQMRHAASEVLVERFGLHRVGPKHGKRRRVAVSESFDEETHSQRVRPVPGPAEEYETRMRSQLLWREYEKLARDGQLSIALYDLEDRNLAETAQELGMPLIRVRRLLERNHNSLRKRLKRLDVRPVEPEPHYGRVWTEPDSTGYDDDWAATSMAYLPDDPDTLVGAAAKHEEEDSEQP